MRKSNVGNLSFVVIFAAASALIFFIFSPFIQILALAAVLAAVFNGLYETLVRKMGGLKSVAAFTVVALVLIFFIVPLFFLGVQIADEIQGLYAGAAGNGAQYMEAIQHAIQNPIRYVFPNFWFDINTYVANSLSFISNNIAGFVARALFIMLETFLMLVAFFFFLRDGRTILEQVASASPFGKEETRELFATLYRTIQSVIKGTLLVALIRWVLLGIIFYFVHIPHALLWSSFGGVIGAIPGVGTPFVFIPAVAYLYFEGNVLGALGLALLGFAMTALVDNMLTPYFLGKGFAVPSIFVLFAILGGVLFFGPLGFIFGPLALSVFLSVFNIYTSMNKASSTRQ